MLHVNRLCRHGTAATQQHFACFPILRTKHRATPGLDDGSLLRSDQAEFAAEEAFVVPGNSRQHSDIRADDVAGVQPTPETRFDDSETGAALTEKH